PALIRVDVAPTGALALVGVIGLARLPVGPIELGDLAAAVVRFHLLGQCVVFGLGAVRRALRVLAVAAVLARYLVECLDDHARDAIVLGIHVELAVEALSLELRSQAREK